MEVSEKAAGKAFEILEKIGGTVGETATEMWPHAVRYVWATGVATMVFCSVFSVVVSVMLIYTYKRLQALKADDLDDVEIAFRLLGMVCCLGGVVGTVAACLWHFTQGLILVLEPTGATLNMLLNGLR